MAAYQGVVVVALGNEPASAQTATTTSSSSSSSSSSAAKKDAVVILDARTGVKVSTHRSAHARSGGITQQGLALAWTCGMPKTGLNVITALDGKGTTVAYATGREAAVGRFASPEQLGPLLASGDGKFVFAGGVSGTLYAWETASGLLLAAWKAHYRAVCALELSADGSLLVSSGDDAMIHVWDLASVLDVRVTRGTTRKPEYTLSAHKMSVTGVASANLGFGASSVFASCSRDHTCRVFALHGAREIMCAVFPCALLCVALDPSRQFAYAGGSDGNIYGVHIPSGRKVVFYASQASINALVVLPDGTLISGAEDGLLRWWEPLSQQCLKSVRTDTLGSPVRAIVVASQTHAAFLRATHTGTLVPMPVLAKFKTSDDADDASSSSSNTTNQANRMLPLERLASKSKRTRALEEDGHDTTEKQLASEATWQSTALKLSAIVASQLVAKGV